MDIVKVRGVSHKPPDRILQLQQLLHEGGVRVFSIAPNMLAEIIKDRKWIGRHDSKGKEFLSFEDFARQPLWDGFDCDVDDLLAICRKRPDVQRLIKKEMDAQPTHAEAGSKGGRGHKAAYNVRSLSGNASTYILKRLKRDRPDLAEKVIAGVMSANAAAIKAGFRKKPVKRCPQCGHEW